MKGTLDWGPSQSTRYGTWASLGLSVLIWNLHLKLHPQHELPSAGRAQEISWLLGRERFQQGCKSSREMGTEPRKLGLSGAARGGAQGLRQAESRAGLEAGHRG